MATFASYPTTGADDKNGDSENGPREETALVPVPKTSRELVPID